MKEKTELYCWHKTRYLAHLLTDGDGQSPRQRKKSRLEKAKVFPTPDSVSCALINSHIQSAASNHKYVHSSTKKKV